MVRIENLHRGVPHLGVSDPHENTFQNAVYLIFKLVGFYTHVEDHTSDGRIDLTLETKDYVYVFEFKVDKSAEEAMRQIKEKEYWKKFMASGKKVILVAANFNTRVKAIDNPILIERL